MSDMSNLRNQVIAVYERAWSQREAVEMAWEIVEAEIRKRDQEYAEAIAVLERLKVDRDNWKCGANEALQIAEQLADRLRIVEAEIQMWRHPDALP